ncbi:MAG: HU family DNA-binding protein [Muribaculaceae bacterium]|nr:HU family DNA-binding protein [Muribaculaceae bacterium]
MNSTITLSQLITRLAKVTATDTNTTRLFLRAFFAAVEDGLAAGETVTIDGIGTFGRHGIGPDESKIVFVADPALAKEINAPFAMFEPVELADGLSFDDENDGETGQPQEEEAPEAVEMPAEEPQTPAYVPEPEPVSAPEPVSEPEPVVAQTPEPEPAPAPEPVSRYVPEEEEEEEIAVPQKPKKKTSSLLWICAAIVILVGGLAGFLAAVYTDDPELEQYNITDIEAVDEEVPAPADSFVTVDVSEAALTTAETTPQPEPAAVVAEEQQPEPEQTAQPRYDTVTSTRYLATMAREYYGRGIYWVYIYKANSDVLDNPNKIRPGTRVAIPERSTFEAETEAETLRKAERIQAELFARYK